MKTADLCNAMNHLAPERLAEGWDNVGLLVGDVAAEVTPRVLLTIDLTDAVVGEAVEAGVGAVVAYHPPIFSAVKRLTAATREGRTVLALARAGACLYSPHTALDAAPGGVADWLLERSAGDREAAGTRRAMTPHVSGDASQAFKLVTFVPAGDVERVASALAQAGAGVIGDYTNCTFRLHGTGTFLGGESTNPAVGERGRLEHAEEIRLETVCPAATLGDVPAALRASHPYEEPAFDVFKREDTPDVRTGVGRVCELSAPAEAGAIADRLKDELGLASVRLAGPGVAGQGGSGRAMIGRIAVCPGAGASVLRDSGLLANAKGLLFVTGEMSHHDVLAAVAAGAHVVLAGHTNTERGYLPVLASRLGAELGSGVEVMVSERDRWPFVERS